MLFVHLFLFYQSSMMKMRGEIMRFTDVERYRKNVWIFMYIEKYDEDDRVIRYQYFLDTDDKNSAGKIEISKGIKFNFVDNLMNKMDYIEDYFEKGTVKIIQSPLNKVDKTEKIEDYNAVYAVKFILENYDLTGIFDNHLLKLERNHFETYVKKHTELLRLTDDKSNDLDFLQYKKEFITDDWLFIKVEKIYEDDHILKYKLLVDTTDEEEYSIMKFSKDITIKRFKDYIRLYNRLCHNKILKVKKNMDRQTIDDFVYNRRSIIALKYILDHYHEGYDYLLQVVIINEEVYGYLMKKAE